MQKSMLLFPCIVENGNFSGEKFFTFGNETFVAPTGYCTQEGVKVLAVTTFSKLLVFAPEGEIIFNATIDNLKDI